MTTEPAAGAAACTLPPDELSLRVAEFDQLFAAALRASRRLAPTRLQLFLDPSAEARARDLVARESACCSFFTFTVSVTDAVLTVDVEVPATRVGVLDAVARRAAEARRAA